MTHKIPKQIEHLENLVELNDVDSLDNLRMPRAPCFVSCNPCPNRGWDDCINTRWKFFKVYLMAERKNLVFRGGPKKGVSTRRTWVPKEEEVLMASLKEIVVQGWKADNGFKVGYLGLLKQHMTDSNARLMWYKCWPLFRDWIEVFGKDRATGEHAADFVEVVNHTLNKTYIDDAQSFEDLETINEDNECQAENMNVSRSQSSASATAKKVGPQKRPGVFHSSLENGITDLELDYVTDDCISDDPDESDHSDEDIQLLNMFSVTIPSSSAYNYNPACLAHLDMPQTKAYIYQGESAWDALDVIFGKQREHQALVNEEVIEISSDDDDDPTNGIIGLRIIVENDEDKVPSPRCLFAPPLVPKVEKKDKPSPKSPPDMASSTASCSPAKTLKYTFI
ncbi:hypothetical protein BUALT_Bualt08G0052600 [Buddleja alternifolia]|uniref:Myb-like domain-containing protein n=1 Tax=Buddleja alternifolia TaxID=168488 RepID=A0AAV6XB26_9LAMI|nr:hypothetical protein BUALT_Bualt08G0052600 [Buddleja alternifolia]